MTHSGQPSHPVGLLGAQVNDALNTVNKALGRKITTLYIQPDVLKSYTRTFVVRAAYFNPQQL